MRSRRVPKTWRSKRLPFFFCDFVAAKRPKRRMCDNVGGHVATSVIFHFSLPAFVSLVPLSSCLPPSLSRLHLSRSISISMYLDLWVSQTQSICISVCIRILIPLISSLCISGHGRSLGNFQYRCEHTMKLDGHQPTSGLAHQAHPIYLYIYLDICTWINIFPPSCFISLSLLLHRCLRVAFVRCLILSRLCFSSPASCSPIASVASSLFDTFLWCLCSLVFLLSVRIF